MEKVKITGIKEYYVSKRRSRDSSGNITMVETTQFRFKEVNYVDGWPRFGHFLLDRLFYYIFVFLFGIAFGLISVVFGFTEIWEDDSLGMWDTLVSILILYPMYYLIFEWAMQSSPGKLILGRIVVNEYGEKPTFRQLLGRSYARIVPFEFLSCLGTKGWHDDWSDTFVIRKKDLQELKLMASVQNFEGKEGGTNPEFKKTEDTPGTLPKNDPGSPEDFIEEIKPG